MTKEWNPDLKVMNSKYIIVHLKAMWTGVHHYPHHLHSTVSDAVNFLFKQSGRAPRGASGVKRSKFSCQIRFWQFEALIFNKNWKNAKNAKNDLKNHCFWPYFDSLLTFSWILALETNKFVFSTNFQNFWHPGHPWERIRSGDILVFVLIFKNSEH